MVNCKRMFAKKDYIYYTLFLILGGLFLFCLALIMLKLLSIQIHVNTTFLLFTGILAYLFAVLSHFCDNIPDNFYERTIFKATVRYFQYFVILLLIISCPVALLVYFGLMLMQHFDKQLANLAVGLPLVILPIVTMGALVASFESSGKKRLIYLILPITVDFLISLTAQKLFSNPL